MQLIKSGLLTWARGDLSKKLLKFTRAWDLLIIALGLLVYVRCRHGVERTRKERAHKDPQFAHNIPQIPKQKGYCFQFFVFPR